MSRRSRPRVSEPRGGPTTVSGPVTQQDLLPWSRLCWPWICIVSYAHLCTAFIYLFLYKQIILAARNGLRWFWVDTEVKSQTLETCNKLQSRSSISLHLYTLFKSLGQWDFFFFLKKLILFSARMKTVKTFIMLWKIFISNKCCSFELSFH